MRPDKGADGSGEAGSSRAGRFSLAFKSSHQSVRCLGHLHMPLVFLSDSIVAQDEEDSPYDQSDGPDSRADLTGSRILGRVKKKVLPSPTLDSTHTLPP